MKPKNLDNDMKVKNSYSYFKGVKLRNSKGKLDIEKLSVSMPNLNLNPETFRKEIWSRKKSEF